MSKYLCPTGNLQCACCYHKLSPAQVAWQRGAVHAGYRWAANPPAEHTQAYLDGYAFNRGQ